MASYEVLIMGGGPAGLNAALALCRNVRKTAVFDSGAYRNYISKHMHTLPTWDHQDSKNFRAAARKEILDRYHTATFVDQSVASVRKLDDGSFEASTAGGEKFVGRKMILATGVQDIYPDIQGYAECWGNTIFHCLFCHGYEERGEGKAGFLAIDSCANPQLALPISGMARQLTSKVTIYTHGNDTFAKTIEADAAEHGHSVDARRIARFEKLEGDTGRLRVHFTDGSSDDLAFMAHTPLTQQSSPFANQLGLELAPNGDIKVNAPFNTTSVHGVFAAGDCSTPMKGVVMALSNGMAAGAGAAHQLAMVV